MNKKVSIIPFFFVLLWDPVQYSSELYVTLERIIWRFLHYFIQIRNRHGINSYKFCHWRSYASFWIFFPEIRRSRLTHVRSYLTRILKNVQYCTVSGFIHVNKVIISKTDNYVYVRSTRTATNRINVDDLFFLNLYPSFILILLQFVEEIIFPTKVREK